MSKKNKPILDVQYTVKEHIEESKDARSLVDKIVEENRNLRGFFTQLRPILEILENELGYKEGDQVESMKFVAEAVELLKNRFTEVTEASE